MSHRVMIVVTHLLGIGHLARMAAVGGAMARQGWQVTIVSGGRPAATVNLDGCHLVQLPPVHCVGSDFSTLYSAPGVVADEAHFDRRRQALLAAFDEAEPEALITELFPFGRRTLAGEFLALLQRAHFCPSRPNSPKRPVILGSIRDVLNPPSKPGRVEEAEARLAAFYDGVLFHGNADVVPLSASWPVSKALARRLLQTGYVHDGERVFAEGGNDGAGEIVVSGGGSAAGLPLSENAVEAARLMPEHRWRLLIGAGVPSPAFERLKLAAPANMVVERARPDFPALLKRCELSISQAGYNTALDLAAANARAILVPFAEGGEREQTIRAGELGGRGWARCLATATLTPEALVRNAFQLLEQPRPDWSALHRDGAARTVEIVAASIAKRRDLSEAWERLDVTLAKAESAGRTVDFWWRDDDAVEPTPALEALLEHWQRWTIPGSLAVIPAFAKPELAEYLQATDVDVLVHGWAHANHAPTSEKKAEFGAHRPIPTMASEAANGLSKLKDLFVDCALPVFVPPWNRVSPDLIPALLKQGYTGLSTFSKRSQMPSGMTQANTHWDPIAWHSGGGLLDEAMLLDLLNFLIKQQLSTSHDEPTPIGLLTHHLVHDSWIDRFLDEVLERLTACKAVRFVSARTIFAVQPGAR